MDENPDELEEAALELWKQDAINELYNSFISPARRAKIDKYIKNMNVLGKIYSTLDKATPSLKADAQRLLHVNYDIDVGKCWDLYEIYEKMYINQFLSAEDTPQGHKKLDFAKYQRKWYADYCTAKEQKLHIFWWWET